MRPRGMPIRLAEPVNRDRQIIIASSIAGHRRTVGMCRSAIPIGETLGAAAAPQPTLTVIG